MYFYYGIIIDVNENGVEICYLYKGIIKKYGEKVFVKFVDGNDNIFNFNCGVKFFFDDFLNKYEVKVMCFRMNEVCLKYYIFYGLKKYL